MCRGGGAEATALPPALAAGMIGSMAGSSRLLGLLVAGACLFAACAPRERLEVLSFYSAICPACEESSRSRNGGTSLLYLARDRKRVELQTWDVSKDEGAQDALFAAVDRYRIPLEKQGLPLLVVNGRASSGLEEAEAAIGELGSRDRRR